MDGGSNPSAATGRSDVKHPILLAIEDSMISIGDTVKQAGAAKSDPWHEVQDELMSVMCILSGIRRRVATQLIAEPLPMQYHEGSISKSYSASIARQKRKHDQPEKP